MSIAFALRAEYEGTVRQVVAVTDGEPVHGDEVPLFSGGVIGIGGDRSFDVREALTDGGGTIVVADVDEGLITALDEYPPLKRVPVPENAEAIDPYVGMSREALRDEAQRRGLSGHARAAKPALRAALLEHDRRSAGGDSAASPTPDNPVTVDELDQAGDAGDQADE